MIQIVIHCVAQGNGVSRLGLFGSFARDEAKAEGEVAVVIEMGEPDLFAMVQIKWTLEEDFQRPVDVIHYRPAWVGFWSQDSSGMPSLYDREFAKEIVTQMLTAVERIQRQASGTTSANDFVTSGRLLPN